jgi:dCMP deaminase
MLLTKWDKRFLSMAREVASWSKDPTTKVGCVIVRGKTELGLGYNGFPPQVKDKDEWWQDREIKNKLVIHAEANAIRKASAHGSLQGCTAYIWPCATCGECAKLLTAYGITKVLAPKSHRTEFEEESAFVFDRAKVDYCWLHGKAFHD